MASLKKCIKKHKLGGDEAERLLSVAHTYREEEGYSADRAATLAVEDALESLAESRKDIYAQLKALGHAPAVDAKEAPADKMDAADKVEAATEKPATDTLEAPTVEATEKPEEGSFLDPSLPVNTGTNARMVVVDKGEDKLYSRPTTKTGTTKAQVETELRTFLGKGYGKLTAAGKLKIFQTEREAFDFINREPALVELGGNAAPRSSDKGGSLGKTATFMDKANGGINGPRRLVSISAIGNSPGANSPETKSFPDAAREDIKLLSDLVKTEPFASEGFGALNVPGQVKMLGLVRRIVNDQKIFDSVIKFIPVDVMDMLRGEKFSPEVLLHDKSVLKYSLSLELGPNIPIAVRQDSAVTSLVRTVASAATEVFSPDLGVVTIDNVSADNTSSDSHGESSFYGQNIPREISTRNTLLRVGEGNTAGIFVQSSGVAILIADNIKKGDAQYVATHELLHKLMFEDKLFKSQHDAIISRFRELRSTDYRVQDAFRRVPTDTPANLVEDEAFAYFIESKANHETSLFKKIIANIRMWLMRMGIPTKNLTTDDLVAMVKQGVHRMANQDHIADAGKMVGEMAPALASVNQTRMDAFKEWFGNSKVVGESGEPLVVYHGTKAQFDGVFDVRGDGTEEIGAFFTTNTEAANMYAGDASLAGGHVAPVFLALKNPYTVTNSQWAAAKGLSPKEARGNGYDGYVIQGMNRGRDKADTYIAFYPNQIKSATGNTGSFSAQSDDIRYSKVASLDNLEEVARVKSESEKRRDSIVAIRDYLELTDADLKKISKKDVRLMTEAEFLQFKSDLYEMSVEFSEHRQKKLELLDIIAQLRLGKVQNLQKAMGLPSISKMDKEQLETFAGILEQYEADDVFLGKRELETVDNTDLAGVKTWRQALKKLAVETGTPIEDLNKITVSDLDSFRWDNALADQNPFYKMLVEGTTKNLMAAQLRYLNIEKKLHDLARKAEASRPRTLSERLVPQERQVFEYIEADAEIKPALAAKMTGPQIDLAHFIQEYFGKALEHLVASKTLNKGLENYFVHMRRSFFEAWKDDGLLKAIKGIFKNYEQDQVAFNILDDDTGNILPLEKFFQYSLKRTGALTPTKNVVRAFLSYAQTFERKVALDAIIPKMEIYAQALTPQVYTARGLEVDKSLKKFVNKWLNNKKGRKLSFNSILPQGGKLDGAINGMRTFTALLDLGLNIPVGVASFVGEQVTNFVMLGSRSYGLGSARMNTAKGKAILEKYKAFTGRSAWEEFTDPGKEITERLSVGIFGLFHTSSVLANKQFLLGSLSATEYASGSISPARMAEFQIQMGRFRIVPGTSSLMGNTSIGGAITQYKKWAVPILRTTTKDISTLLRDLKNKPIGEALNTREARELYRIIGVSSTAVLVGMMLAGGDDDDFLGKIKAKAYRESTSLMQGLDPKLWLSVPRVMTFLAKFGDNLNAIITLEEYKTKEGYKGIGGMRKQFTPHIARALTPAEEDLHLKKVRKLGREIDDEDDPQKKMELRSSPEARLILLAKLTTARLARIRKIEKLAEGTPREKVARAQAKKKRAEILAEFNRRYQLTR